jgi:hypothetical protein
MTLSPTLPQSAVDLVVAMLVRLILPALAGDAEAAKALALAMLAEYQPQTIRELRLASEIVGLSLDSLNALVESAQPGVPAERLATSRRWACSLSRTGYQAQRRLDTLQRARHGGSASALASDIAVTAPRAALPSAQAQTSVPQTAPLMPSQPEAPPHGPPQPQASHPAVGHTRPTQAQPAQDLGRSPLPEQSQAPQPQPQPALSESPLSQAEGTYVVALAHLNFMKARHKGAPPPHSQAAQQIQAQQRVVDAARMKLELLRKQMQHAAPRQEPIRAAA